MATRREPPGRVGEIRTVQGATVLVVDDDPSIRDVLVQFLEDEGYRPLTAANGAEALGILRNGKQPPDMMLLDILMPELNGYEVLKVLRDELLQEFPVLLFSAQRPEPEIRKALDSELRDFIAKPFELEELLLRMQILQGRSPRFGIQQQNCLRIYALGSLRVFLDQTLLFDESWRNKPAKTIFKLLFTNAGQRYPKDVLAEELWPEADPDAATNRLRVAIYELRKMLGQQTKDKGANYIAQQEGSYYFDESEACWSDVRAFEEHSTRARELMEAERFEEALHEFQSAEALYQGDYLRDDPFFEWSVSSRERLREEHLSMLSDVARIYADLGQPREAADFCRKILRYEPWHEGVYRHMMEYLVADGRPNEALRAYADCSRTLRAELDAEPSSETTRLRDQIAERTYQPS